MSKLSLIFKSFSLLVAIFFTQNALAQGQQKLKNQPKKPQIAQTQPEIKAPEVQNTNPSSPQPEIVQQPNFSLDEHKKEIERIQLQHQKVADKIRSLTPEQRQIVKDEIRRHRETMKDLLGDAWQDLEAMPHDFEAPTQPAPQPNVQYPQNQNGSVSSDVTQPVNNSNANPPLPQMPNINPNGKSPNQLPKPPVPVQR